MSVEEDEAIAEAHSRCVELTECVEGGASIEFRGLEGRAEGKRLNESRADSKA